MKIVNICEVMNRFHDNLLSNDYIEYDPEEIHGKIVINILRFIEKYFNYYPEEFEPLFLCRPRYTDSIYSKLPRG